MNVWFEKTGEREIEIGEDLGEEAIVEEIVQSMKRGW